MLSVDRGVWCSRAIECSGVATTELNTSEPKSLPGVFSQSQKMLRFLQELGGTSIWWHGKLLQRPIAETSYDYIKLRDVDV